MFCQKESYRIATKDQAQHPMMNPACTLPCPRESGVARPIAGCRPRAFGPLGKPDFQDRAARAGQEAAMPFARRASGAEAGFEALTKSARR